MDKSLAAENAAKPKDKNLLKWLKTKDLSYMQYYV